MIKLELILEFCFYSDKLVNHLFNKLWKLLILIVIIMNRINNLTFRSEDVKTFIKFSSKFGSTENSIFKKVFLAEDNRQILNLHIKGNPVRSFKSDYIYNEYENTILMFCKIKPNIIELINSNKNLSFFSFGQEKLG